MNSKVAYLVQDGATTDVTRSYGCSTAKVSVGYFVVEDATEVNLFEEKQSGWEEMKKVFVVLTLPVEVRV